MDHIEYQLEDVKAARIASDDIDKTFKSSSIGEQAQTVVSHSPVC